MSLKLETLHEKLHEVIAESKRHGNAGDDLAEGLSKIEAAIYSVGYVLLEELEATPVFVDDGPHSEHPRG